MPPRKRAAEQPATNPVQKRPATQQPTPGPSEQPTPVITIPDEPDYDLLVSLRLSPKFNIFPEKLRKKLVTGIQISLRTLATKVEANAASAIGEPHSIIDAQGFKGSCDAFETLSCKEHSADVHFANKQLLVMALVKFKKILKPDNFVELDPPEHEDLIANPKFVHWHSVRHGEIGWGFDKHDCLSLYTTKFVDSTVLEEVLYVKRAEFVVKVES